MYTRYVDRIDADTVRLWVELFYGNESFTLTVTDNIRDAYGDTLPAPYNSITIEPFQSTATMGNFNGKVRTWHESNLVSADSQRIYLAGNKGIDVFKKEENLIPSRWAQVFDSYGVNAMFVAHFGGDYEFVDTSPPYFTYQNPFPGTTVSASSSIYITVADADTSVEPTGVTVYINELLAFSGGSGGWANGFSGSIQIGYQSLEMIFTPPAPFEDGEEVEVRVIAWDISGNIMDASYSFYIGVVVLGDGFGGSEFGTSPFGGV